MYTPQKANRTTINVNSSYEGETIEKKVRRVVNNKEPIKDGAPLIYTERKDGVQPAYDIRTDRWEVAIEAMDKIAAYKVAKRDERMGEQAFNNMTAEQKQEFVTKFPGNQIGKDWQSQASTNDNNQ